MEKNNVNYICNCCADERKTEWQRSHFPQDITLGSFVKLAISEQPDDAEHMITEHMWVKVTGLAGDYTGLFTGVLDNIPVRLNNYTLGDPITFTFTDVQDMLS